MIDPRRLVFWVPPELKAFKMRLFDRIARGVEVRGGKVLRQDFTQLARLSDEQVPVVGCSPYLRPLVSEWRARGRDWIYWDRGYVRRVFATDLPVGRDGGYYRWHVGSFQLERIFDAPGDRWAKMDTPLWPWSRGGRHVVVAEPSDTYQKFHGIEGWTARTLAHLKSVTDRPIVVRNKEMQRSSRRLREDLRGAHCLVTHGSNAAVEAVIMGCPVFVCRDSAAALVGRTDWEIELPLYPDREPWARALAYSQFDERELEDGTVWKMMRSREA